MEEIDASNGGDARNGGDASNGNAEMQQLEEGNQVEEASEGEEQPMEAAEEPPLEATEENAKKLMDSGCAAMKSGDYETAIDDLSRCLEIRVSLYGELAPECATAYYKYGCALLYKVQEESSDTVLGPEGRALKISEPNEQQGNGKSEAKENVKDKNELQEIEAAEEEESDLELAWKMTDIARVIYEKQRAHSIEEVDVITTLGDISLEKDDFKTCFEDYTKALEIMRGLVDSDDWHLAELYFKIALAHQLDGKAKEALEFCEKAISVTESRVQNLKSGNISLADHQKQGGSPIEVLESLLTDMKEKAEELQQMASAPPLLEALEADHPALAETVKQTIKAITGLSTPGEGSSLSRPSTSNGAITDLGVVGRGIKRTAPIRDTESEAGKRPLLGDGPSSADAEASVE